MYINLLVLGKSQRKFKIFYNYGKEIMTKIGLSPIWVSVIHNEYHPKSIKNLSRTEKKIKLLLDNDEKKFRNIALYSSTVCKIDNSKIDIKFEYYISKNDNKYEEITLNINTKYQKKIENEIIEEIKTFFEIEKIEILMSETIWDFANYLIARNEIGKINREKLEKEYPTVKLIKEFL